MLCGVHWADRWRRRPARLAGWCSPPARPARTCGTSRSTRPSWSTTPRWTRTCTIHRHSRRSRPSSSSTSPTGTGWAAGGSSTSAAGRVSSFASCATGRLHGGRLRRDVRRNGRPGRLGCGVPQLARPARCRPRLRHVHLAPLVRTHRRSVRLPRGFARAPAPGPSPATSRCPTPVTTCRCGLGGHLPPRLVLRRVFVRPGRRAGRLAGGGHRVHFSGMFRYIEISANRAGRPRSGTADPAGGERDRQLASLAGFPNPHSARGPVGRTG